MDIDHTRRNKKPRQLQDPERAKLEEFIDAIHYSARCVVDFFFLLFQYFFVLNSHNIRVWMQPNLD
jgi:hypothetical protein